MAATTIVDTLWERLYKMWRDEGWSVVHHSHRHKHRKLVIGEFNLEEREVHLYPHPQYQDIASTGLHEMIHILFRLDGSDADERTTLWMEQYLWKRLSRKRKQILRDIFEPKE